MDDVIDTNTTEGHGTELSNRRVNNRRTLIRKEGQSNLIFKGIKQKRVRYLKDIYITLLDIKWRWAFLILFSGFLGSYFFFSVIYYLMSYIHGDIANADDPNYTPCIVNLKSYLDALLFSIETQSTLGYGTIYPHAECSGTVPVVFLQITLGFLIETMLLGFVFVKVARPKHRRHTLIFSQHACICKEDNYLTLQIRVGDIRNTHLIDTHLYGVLVKRHVSEEKYVYPLFQHEIEFEAHGMGDRLFLIWPMVLRHKITSESPLYTLTPNDYQEDNFQLLILLEGTIESTGEMVQARTSFTNSEILWGHRFAPIEEYDDKNDKWCIDFIKFNDVIPSTTPRCSAKNMNEQKSRTDAGEPEDGSFIMSSNCN
uniref:Inward rectifier potassium channel C-terminal domain-containing protein n=1 Tax=Arion vulgaris TaxID=1028688 RepID=A0A0B6ZLP1_9EUPU